MNTKFDKQLQKVQAAYSENQASIANLQSSQAQMEQQMTRLNLAQEFARQGVTRDSHPWPHLAGSE